MLDLHDCRRQADPMDIRSATRRDDVWPVLMPTIRAGDAYALPSDMTRDDAVEWFFAAGNRPFAVTSEGRIVAAFYLRANARGGGAHVANAGFFTHPEARGRGIASAMCEHAMQAARAAAYLAMQFNFVVATNPAVRLWQRHGFDIVGTLPAAFTHPTKGYVDVYVMYRRL